MAAASSSSSLQLVNLAVLARLLTPADFSVAAASNVIIAFSMLFSIWHSDRPWCSAEELTPDHIGRRSRPARFTESDLFGDLCIVGHDGGYFRMPPVSNT